MLGNLIVLFIFLFFLLFIEHGYMCLLEAPLRLQQTGDYLKVRPGHLP